MRAIEGSLIADLSPNVPVPANVELTITPGGQMLLLVGTSKSRRMGYYGAFFPAGLYGGMLSGEFVDNRKARIDFMRQNPCKFAPIFSI